MFRKEQEVVLRENIACKDIKHYMGASFIICESMTAFE
jgi:hypothetical protein